MSENPEVQALESLLAAVERGREIDRELLDITAMLRERVVEQGEGLVTLSNRIEGHYRSARRVLVTKAAVDAMTCQDCGNEYAREPGPELCGPCWARHGKPEVWPPANVEPIASRRELP